MDTWYRSELTCPGGVADFVYKVSTRVPNFVFFIMGHLSDYELRPNTGIYTVLNMYTFYQTIPYECCNLGLVVLLHQEREFFCYLYWHFLIAFCLLAFLECFLLQQHAFSTPLCHTTGLCKIVKNVYVQRL